MLDVPLIQLIVEEARLSGIKQIAFVVSQRKSVIRNYFSSNGLDEISAIKGNTQAVEQLKRIINEVDLQFIDQPEQKGLGDAVLQAKTFVGDSPFVVMLGDTLTRSNVPVTRQLIDVFNTVNAPVIGVESVAANRIDQYGMIDAEHHSEGIYTINSLIEKPTIGSIDSTLAIAGRYLLPATIFNHLERTNIGRGGEIQLTDAIAALILQRPGYACRFSGRRLDLGSRTEFIRANILAALDRKEYRDETLSLLEEILADCNNDI